jgi:hypothetical protein
MPLGPALKEDQRRIVELTEQKFRILNQLARMPRVVISGGAGRGRSAWRSSAGGRSPGSCGRAPASGRTSPLGGP